MPAAALYTSPLFRKSLLAALDTGEKAYILSAKHGVLSCGEVIEPYDVTLKALSRSARQEWGKHAGDQLKRLIDRKTAAIMYCGEEYIAPIRQQMMEARSSIEEPLAGLSIGQRLQTLSAINGENQLRSDVAHFYRILRPLWLAQGGGRVLSESSGKMAWPDRGVYFFFEMPGGLTHGAMPRIVRVGTHAVSAGSRTSLWHRLSTHRGTGVGGGSHRSSIFRSHVGYAIMSRDSDGRWPSTWGQGQSAPRAIRDGETKLERLVSDAIGRMRVIWLDVPDDAGPNSDRAYLERNAIGLLSRANLLAPLKDEEWLGRHSREWRISVSGLWNLNHVFARPAPQFLDRLSRYVHAMVGHPDSPQESIARKRPGRRTQLSLFSR